MEPQDNAFENVNKYYEHPGMALWEIITRGQLHLGYWDKGNEALDFAEATLNLTRLMIRSTTISKGELFLDIGCGTGMPGIRLANEKECRVHGVTISPLQQELARKNAADTGMDDQVAFFCANALDMPFEDSTYDGAWFFESIFHMGHEKALAEASRVMKPGADLVIADLSDLGTMTDAERRLAKEMVNAVYTTAEAYPDLLSKAGFALLEITDITRQVMDLFEEKYLAAIRENRETLLRHVDEDFLPNLEVIAGQLAKSAGYLIVKAKKI